MGQRVVVYHSRTNEEVPIGQIYGPFINVPRNIRDAEIMATKMSSRFKRRAQPRMKDGVCLLSVQDHNRRSHRQNSLISQNWCALLRVQVADQFTDALSTLCCTRGRYS